MAIRIFTSPEESPLILEDFNNLTQPKPYAYTEWTKDSLGRLTLNDPYWTGEAFFRISAFPGCNVITFDLEPPENSFLNQEVYAEYHSYLMDFIYDNFSRRFHLLEKTPYEQKGRPLIDDPLMDSPNSRPPRRIIFNPRYPCSWFNYI